MTYQSESRGLMYTSPPSGEESDEDVRNELTEPEETTERATTDSPTLGETSATTDANWTGTVPADD